MYIDNHMFYCIVLFVIRAYACISISFIRWMWCDYTDSSRKFRLIFRINAGTKQNVHVLYHLMTCFQNIFLYFNIVTEHVYIGSNFYTIHRRLLQMNNIIKFIFLNSIVTFRQITLRDKKIKSSFLVFCINEWMVRPIIPYP